MNNQENHKASYLRFWAMVSVTEAHPVAGAL